MLCAIGTGLAPARGAWLVSGPDFWRESGVDVVVRGMPWRAGPWRARVRLFRDVAREAGSGSARAIEPVLCGLCGLPGRDLDRWAAAHPLCYVGTNRRMV